jgi:3-oxoacyl-[acyl-carrier protein] reductase
MTALDARVSLVTGASRGIGAAIAAQLAELGSSVIVHYGNRREAAEAVAANLPGEGHRVIGCDLRDSSAAAEMIDDIQSREGRLDVLVNNAGIYTDHPPLASDRTDWLTSWEAVLAVNLLSPAALCHAAARLMRDQGGGRIINIGSRGAFRGEPKGPAYGASKAALHSMSQSLAVALAPSGIRVVAIAPGFVETDMAKALLEGETGDAIRGQSPLNRVAKPEEVADLVGYLATTDAEFLTGGIIDLNGASYLRS